MPEHGTWWIVLLVAVALISAFSAYARHVRYTARVQRAAEAIVLAAPGRDRFSRPTMTRRVLWMRIATGSVDIRIVSRKYERTYPASLCQPSVGSSTREKATRT